MKNIVHVLKEYLDGADITEAAKYFIERYENCIAHVWGIEDVLSKAEELCVELSEEDALNILKNIEDNLDCTQGITWDTIEYTIEDYVDYKTSRIFREKI